MVFTLLFNILVSLVLCLTYITSQCRWALDKCHRDTDFLSVKVFVFGNVFTIHRWERGFVFHISNKTVDHFTPRPRYTARFSLQAGSLVCTYFSNQLRHHNFPRNDASEHTLLTWTATVVCDESTDLAHKRHFWSSNFGLTIPVLFLYNFIQCTPSFLQFHVRRKIPRSYRLLYH